MAIQPGSWPAASEWRQILLRTWKEASDDNVGLLAAGVAFYGFLAFVPLLASAVLTYGLVAAPETVADHIRTLAQTLPREAAAIIADQLQAITGDKEASHGLGLLLAIGIAVYGASKGAAAVVTALNIAHEVKESRGFVKRTALSLLMTVGAMLVLLVAALAISALGFVEHLLPFSSPLVHTSLKLLFWAATAAVVSLGLALVYRYGPDRPDAPWAWITPGSAGATLLWLLASLGFGLYVSNFGNYNATYGSLGGVVVFLTWVYLSAYILLMGAELNSELERQQAEVSVAKIVPVSAAPNIAAPPSASPSTLGLSDASAPRGEHPTSVLPGSKVKAAALLVAGGAAGALLRRWSRKRGEQRYFHGPSWDGAIRELPVR